MLWRDGDSIRLRTRVGDVTVGPAGDARAGDLVAGAGAGPPLIVRRFEGGDYPQPRSEVARLPPQRLEALARRTAVLRGVRGFFDRLDFAEVDVPVRVPAPGLEVHLDAVAAGEHWLITSPEYQMKRLLAAELGRIYALCRCSRAGESGSHHQPEFTMLEWYRGWARLEDVLRDTEELVAELSAAILQTTRLSYGGHALDLEPPWPRRSVADLMEEWAGVAIRGDEEAGELAARLRAAGIDVGEAVEWDDLFYSAFVSRVEPRLGALDRPLVVVDWPVALCALAREVPGRPEVVERFEVYAGGLELCNAFGELTCATEQRRRFEEDQRRRARAGRPVYPIDEKLLAALEEGLPPSAGNALGVDRLVMLLADRTDIRDVVWFTADEL
ncbi:MAG TPA: EF-P lysine aminoacylase EpmA [Kofleriaceae bacterium]|nr:EF-P lysine aminoacylase EpmA [Kofleriaceae bacterium]